MICVYRVSESPQPLLASGVYVCIRSVHVRLECPLCSGMQFGQTHVGHLLLDMSSMLINTCGCEFFYCLFLPPWQSTHGSCGLGRLYYGIWRCAESESGAGLEECA